MILPFFSSVSEPSIYTSYDPSSIFARQSLGEPLAEITTAVAIRFFSSPCARRSPCHFTVPPRLADAEIDTCRPVLCMRRDLWIFPGIADDDHPLFPQPAMTSPVSSPALQSHPGALRQASFVVLMPHSRSPAVVFRLCAYHAAPHSQALFLSNPASPISSRC